MQHFSLSGNVRETGGKAAVKALRKQGLVPCNLYGCGVENVLFTVSAKELKGLTDTPASYIVDLTLDSGKKFTVVLPELQWHPVTDECLHADFLVVTEDKPVSINVPLEIVGHAIGVQQGGKFYQSIREIRISALLAHLPQVSGNSRKTAHLPKVGKGQCDGMYGHRYLLRTCCSYSPS